MVVAAACDKWEAVGCMARESLFQPLPLTRMLTALLFIVGVTPNTIAQFIRVWRHYCFLFNPTSH